MWFIEWPIGCQVAALLIGTISRWAPALFLIDVRVKAFQVFLFSY